MYDWDDIPEPNDQMPLGRQDLVIYDAYESKNANGKPFLKIKFAKPEDLESAFYDKDGELSIYPHAFLNIYYQTDYGKKALKNLLKSAFGQDRLKELKTNEVIIHYLKNEKPFVSGIVYEDNGYIVLKDFMFRPAQLTTTGKQGLPPTQPPVNAPDIPKPDTSQTKQQAQLEQPGYDTDDDLPF